MIAEEDDKNILFAKQKENPNDNGAEYTAKHHYKSTVILLMWLL